MAEDRWQQAWQAVPEAWRFKSASSPSTDFLLLEMGFLKVPKKNHTIPEKLALV